VTITARDRKILWGLAGNACARCDTRLVQLPEADEDVHAMVGQECHIVGKELSGPRGMELPPDGVDDYSNLILLCANCHAVIDDQVKLWTLAKLRELKLEHEQRMAKRTAPAGPGLPEFKLRGRDRNVRLERMVSGDRLLSVMTNCLAHQHNTPEGVTAEQRTLIGDFLQSAQDWAEIYDEIGPKGHADAGQDLQEGIDGLLEEALVVYAGIQRLTLVNETDGSETPWPTAIVQILHLKDAVVDRDAEREASAD
jgi:HNH endonuclease